jgi:hypothetical protein
MDAGEELAAEIRDAVSSGRDLWVFDQVIERDVCSDSYEAAFLTSIIRALENE